MNPELLAALLNGAILAIQEVRKLGATQAEVDRLLAQDSVTPNDVRLALIRWEAKINEGRNLG